MLVEAEKRTIVRLVVEGRDPGSWTAVGGMPSWSRSRTNDWSS
jgi:hypothetical protein